MDGRGTFHRAVISFHIFFVMLTSRCPVPFGFVNKIVSSTHRFNWLAMGFAAYIFHHQLSNKLKPDVILSKVTAQGLPGFWWNDWFQKKSYWVTKRTAGSYRFVRWITSPFRFEFPTHHFTAGSTSKMSWRFLLHPSTKSSCVAQKSEVMSIKTTYQLAKRYKTLTHLGKTSNSMFRCLAWDLREDLEKFQNSFKFNSSKFQTFEWNLQIIASSEGEFYCFTAFEFICSTFFFGWLS